MSLAYASLRKAAWGFTFVGITLVHRYPNSLKTCNLPMGARSPRAEGYGTFTESWLSEVRKLILAVRSSLSHAKRWPSMARFTVLNSTIENSWR